MPVGQFGVRALLATSAFRLALVYAVLFTASSLLLFGILYWSTLGSISRQIDATIESEIRGLAEQYERQGLAGLADVLSERVRNARDGRSVYVLVDDNGRILSGNLERWPTVPASGDGPIQLQTILENGESVPVRAYVLSVGRYHRLLVGRDVRELAQLGRVFERAAIWGTAAVVILAIAGGLLMSISAQRRVSAINRTARRIIDGNLSERVPISGGRDEYDGLAANINEMLGKIEILMDNLRHAGDSIAHDLKTPLTRLRNHLEILAESEELTPGQLHKCVAESDHLLATFNALLRIARIESGAYRAAFREVNLAEIVRGACELYQAAADEKGVTVTLRADDDVPLFGDRELLAQAVSNLLDNAIKYTPPAGSIEIDIKPSASRVLLSVSDDGPGVPAGDRERIEKRFVRLDAARSEPGNGLGLALVRAVVDQHHGTLSFGDAGPGLLVRMAFPLRPHTRAPGKSPELS